MARILHPEFRDRHDDSMYPFGDNASLVSDDDLAELFSTTFIDAAIYPIGSITGVGISKIVVGDGRTAKIYIGDEDTDELAVGELDFIAPSDSIVLQDSYQRPAGVLISDANRLSIFQSWRPGTYRFLSATFVASVVTPVPEIGVRGFLTVDTATPELFYGDTWLVGEHGAVVRREGSTIRVDFVGDPLFRRKLCSGDPDMFDTPNFLETINGHKPDSAGNFNLTVGEHAALDSVLRISPIEAGLKITAIGQPLETARITRVD
jgi:hypothetical protein